jgi:hypothetical protein
MVSELDLQLCVGSNLVSPIILDGHGAKVMPGSIPAPNSGLVENKKNTDSQQQGSFK